MTAPALPGPLKAAIADNLTIACATPRRLLVLPRRHADPPRIEEALGALEARRLSDISGEIGILVGWALEPSYQYLSAPERCRSLVARAAEMMPESPVLLSLARSGYLREAAVNAYPPVSNAVYLALLLLRANDWVSQVRRAAA